MIARFPDDTELPATLLRFLVARGEIDEARAFLRETAEDVAGCAATHRRVDCLDAARVATGRARSRARANRRGDRRRGRSGRDRNVPALAAGIRFDQGDRRAPSRRWRPSSKATSRRPFGSDQRGAGPYAHNKRQPGRGPRSDRRSAGHRCDPARRAEDKGELADRGRRAKRGDRASAQRARRKPRRRRGADAVGAGLCPQRRQETSPENSLPSPWKPRIRRRR
jgi:hypothetical protein